MKILFLGDIIGNPGRACVINELPWLIKNNDIDMVIANGENSAGGFGINPKVADILFGCGIDVLTSGNHIYNKKEIYEYIEYEGRLLKPANFPPLTPGNGYCIFSSGKTNGTKTAVINICGRVFMENLDCPFRKMDELLEEIKSITPVIIVDFHAEATSEKVAMGWYLDGRVSAVIGTHTHVQTADERILPKGTAYISDSGMVGPRDSVIGVKKELIIDKFLKMMPQKFVVAENDNWVNGVIIEIDEKDGHAKSIERLNYAAG
ncbi:MAG: TIGR00282 family metallophosphoesterase [Actinobacteria bacterium]|nr:TIGR00282 family metallophosphoesterase [Actinomycetota bacterium]